MPVLQAARHSSQLIVLSKRAAADHQRYASKGKCEHSRDKNPKSHNCNRKRIVSRYSKHRGLLWPDPRQGLVVAEKARKPLLLLWLPHTWLKTRLEVWKFLIRKINTLGA